MGDNGLPARKQVRWRARSMDPWDGSERIPGVVLEAPPVPIDGTIVETREGGSKLGADDRLLPAPQQGTEEE